ncbi:MAG: FKBP-type peptidyl-prolyl cis-trans isomerase [Candidatus Micrarchaeia archaeon]
MSFKDGDFLEIEYTIWDAATNEMIFSTDEKRAKESEIYSDQNIYGSMVVVLGSGSTIKGMENILKDMKEKETRKATFEPADAFGERNEDLIRVVPLSTLKQQNINPYVGLTVDVDGVKMIVKSINSGRVVLDANHPLAGKTLIYEISVIKQVKDPKEQIEMLATKRYNIKPSSININNKEASLTFDNSINKDANYFVAKASLIAAIFSYIKDINKVNINEEYLKPKEDNKNNQSTNK